MDRIVNWLLLIIIFVFDPLAISLVVAANFAFAQLRSKNEYPIEEKVGDEIKDWDVTLNDGLEDKPHHFLDLDKDGVVEAEEIEAVIDQVSAIGNSFTTAEGGKKAALNAEVQKLKDMILSTVPKKKKDDNTITYF